MRVLFLSVLLLASGLLLGPSVAVSQEQTIRTTGKGNKPTTGARKSTRYRSKAALRKVVQPDDYTTGVCKDFCWLNPDLSCCKGQDQDNYNRPRRRSQ
jgi:hypothetical protein